MLYTSTHLQEPLWGPGSPGVPSLQEAPEKEKEEAQIELALLKGKKEIKVFMQLNSGLFFTSNPGRPGGPRIPGKPSSPCTGNSYYSGSFWDI